MARPTSTFLAALLLAAVALAPAVPLGAQLSEGLLAPAGRLRIELSPSFDLWDRRFGVHVRDGERVEGSEPLAWDLENAPLLRLAPLEGHLRTALGTGPVRLLLGSTRALVLRDRTGISFGAALGVFDWLTLGVRAPLVKARTEVAVDFRAGSTANVGMNPRLAGDGRVTAFLAGLAAGRTALQTRVGQGCPGPECAALTDLLGRYTAFQTGLSGAYAASPLFITQGSAEAILLAQRVTALRQEIGARAAGVPLPGDPPLASGPLDQKQLGQLLTDPAAGVQLLQPLASDASFWQLGDVELSAAFRLLEGAVRDSAAARARFRYLIGGQALVRLPTGHPDNPDIPLDIGSGDGQLDLEAGAFADLRWTRLGLRGEARFGVQRATDLLRRVAPPEEVFAPFATRSLVRWTPGRYLGVELAPAWYLIDELSLGGLYRLSSKTADRYQSVGDPSSVIPTPDPASLLEDETATALHEVGVGVAFSTLTTWRDGRTGLPFEVRLAVRHGLAGTGNAPAGTRMEATGRLFVRLWGAEPAPVTLAR